MSTKFSGELYALCPAGWTIASINSSSLVIRMVLSRFCPIKKEKLFVRPSVTRHLAERFPVRAAKLIWREVEYAYEEKLRDESDG